MVLAAAARRPSGRRPSSCGRSASELTTRLCGDGRRDVPDASSAAGSTITTTLDMRLQGIAEKWVKAATIVPNAKNPRATAKALGLPYEPLDGQPARARTSATAR